MSREQFEQFREVVLQDVSLQKRLRNFTRHDKFIARVVELGAERGFEFTADEVLQAINARRREWIERWI